MPDLAKILNLQIGVAEEEKVKFFILQDTWPIFKLFQIFGFFPIKKVTDENGNISLQPTGIWRSIVIQSILLLVFSLPWIGKLMSGSFVTLWKRKQDSRPARSKAI